MTSQMFRRIALLLALAALSSACATATRNLTVDEKEFLDKTSIIMKPADKKEFLRLPAEQRKEWMEDFWKRRDPDPTTEINEYKIEYFKRIEEANRLFREGSSKNGWRTDRGRIYMLVGEPDRRDVYPTGYSFYEPPVEIWSYGFFKIIFVDYQREGVYKLEPGSAWQISQINAAQTVLNRSAEAAKPEGGGLDFVMQKRMGAGDLCTLEFLVPVKAISFSRNAEKNAQEAVLKLQVEIRDAKSNARVDGQSREFPLSLTAEQLEKVQRFLVLALEFHLPPGRYLAQASVENSVDKTKIQREFDLKI